jgi:hypothetical protein
MPASKKSVLKKEFAVVAHQILSLFGPAPLPSTEGREHFEQLLTQLVIAIAPANTIERMWVYDVAVLVWETMRLRRYKAVLIERKPPDSVFHVAQEFLGDDSKVDVISYIRDGEPRRRLADALAEKNLTTDLIDAESRSHRA